MKAKRNYFRLYFLLFVLISYNCSLGIAQQKPPLNFDHLTTKEGLSNNDINTILQDSRGFMWIGTRNGLNRYDGHNFKTYKYIPTDTLSMLGNWVDQIVEDSSGYLWLINAASGFNRYDPVTETFLRFDSEDIHPIRFDGEDKVMMVDSKNQIWISGFRGIICIDATTLNIKTYLNNPEDIESIPAGHIGGIDEDKYGNIWVWTQEGILGYFESKTEKWTQIVPNLGLADSPSVQAPLLIKNEEILVGHGNSGLIKYNPQKKVWTKLTDNSKNIQKLSHGMIYTLFEDSQNQLWVGTEKGLNLMQSEGVFFHYFYDPLKEKSLSDHPIKCIVEDNKGTLWIGTEGGGLNIWDSYKVHFEHFKKNPFNTNSLSHNSVTSAIEDGDNGLWICTWGGGLNYLDFETHTFTHYSERTHPEIFPGNWVAGYSPEGSSNHITFLNKVLFQTAAGHFYFDKSTKEFHPYLDEAFHAEYPGQFVFQTSDSYGNRYYLNLEEGGISVYDSSTEKTSHYKHVAGDSTSISSNEIGTVQETSKGKIFYSEIDAIRKTSNDKIWICTRNGLNLFNPETKKFKRFLHDPKNPNSISSNNINSIFEDPSGNIWINYQTHHEISFIPHEALKRDSIYFVHFNFENSGIESSGITGIQVDGKENVWVCTIHGLYQFGNTSQTFEQFTLAENFQGFNWWGFKKGESGKFYIGTSNGLFVFHPDSIRKDIIPPPIFITDFKLNSHPGSIPGISKNVLEENYPLKKSVLFTEEITLTHQQNDFSFEFAALNYTLPQRNKYQYQLVNYNENWINTTADRAYATYTNIPPGEYTFRVIGSNNDGFWNEEGTSITLTILPPWYWAWWSKTLYAFIMAGMLYVLYRFQLNRQLAFAEAKRLQELDSFKTRLYTNITHEFRTPLTVISGMADQVLQEPRKWFQEGLTMIKRNSQQLLNLVNQMLDLSKLEAGTLSVQLVQDDMVIYLNYLTESFHSYAETKDIRLHFSPDMDELTMDYDPDKVQAIFTNLIGNAIKFTPAGGDVYIRLRETQDEHCQIEVTDTGIGIPEAQLPHIFDRFYQADDSVTRQAEGTGIGLALTKELVKLLDGTIEVQSQPDQGTIFTIRLPIRREATIEETPPPASTLSPDVDAAFVMPSTVKSSVDRELPVALLIEDNQDVLHYLASCLEGQYRLEMAIDGQKGIEKALEAIPDIIISDVMMPQKDGFEVVQTLKNDERTSHIPIILLTAKADVASRIEGLERGADAYLAKPFDKKELEVRLRKLIELRQQLQTRYGALSPLSPTDNIAFAKEDRFLLKVRQLVEENIEDENYGIEELCDALRISRVQLHRKLKALTDKSTSHVIRSIRLQKAYPLLLESNLNITEIAYKVGFSSSKYFSQVFKEEFGQTPSNFRQK